MNQLDREERESFGAELEGFFTDAQALVGDNSVKARLEAEADVVATVLVTEVEAGAADRVAGIPGAAVAGFAPIVVEWFLSLVLAFFEQVQKESLDNGAKGVVERVKGWIVGRTAKKGLRRVDVSKRYQTIAQIAKTLEEAGWPRDAVEGAAKDLVDRGERAARAVARPRC